MRHYIGIFIQPVQDQEPQTWFWNKVKKTRSQRSNWLRVNNLRNW
jgi:hypothetical protein